MNKKHFWFLTGDNNHPNVSAYLTELDAEGYDRPDANTIREMNRFFNSINSIIADIERFKTTLVGFDGERETVDLIAPTATKASYPSGIDGALNGWKGDGVADYVLLGYNYSTDAVKYTQNDASRFLWVEEVATVGDFLDGQTSLNGNSMRNISSTQQRICQSTNNQSAVIDFSGTGLVGLTRIDSTNVSGYNDTTKTDRTSTSVANGSAEASLLRLGATYSNARISCHLIGRGLTQAKVTIFRDAYLVFRAGVGLSFALGAVAYGLGQTTWGLGQL